MIPAQAPRGTRPSAAAPFVGGHTEFSRVLAERGHTITGGAELRSTRTAMTVRGTAESVTVTDGPFAETAEQLGGFYVVETDDLDDRRTLVSLIRLSWPLVSTGDASSRCSSVGSGASISPRIACRTPSSPRPGRGPIAGLRQTPRPGSSRRRDDERSTSCGQSPPLLAKSN